MLLTRLLLVAFAIASLSAATATPSATASAHNPHYEDVSLWGPVVKKSYHAQETWPKGRLWTWAKPGTSMGEKENPLEPKNWLEDGKPATQPCDENTDFDFPDSQGGYNVTIYGSKGPITWRRHLTVGRNATVTWLHGAKGNTWIKAGGMLIKLTYIGGDKHAFLRNDNKESWWMADHMFCDKAPQASIEILGPFSVDDSYHFNSGMTILGVDSSITPQARSNLNIQPDAALALLDGAKYLKQGNQTFACDLIVRGRLLGGLPERPLTRDATLGLSWKGKRRNLGGKNTTFRGENPDDVAFIVMPAFSRSQYVDGQGWQNFPMPAGSVQVFSSNPTKARLVLDWNGLPVSKEAAKGGPENEANYTKLAEVKDTFIEIMLLGDVNPVGLFINHAAKGGVIVSDPTDAKWKSLMWGTKNAAPASELLQKWDGQPRSLFNNSKDF